MILPGSTIEVRVLGSVNRGNPSRPTSATLHPACAAATRSGIRAYPIQGVRPLGAESLPWSYRPPEHEPTTHVSTM